MTFELWPEGAPGAKGTGLEDRPRLTPYLVEGGTPRGVVIVCPGGGYGGRAAHEGKPIAEWLNGIGISAFVLDYRVAPYRHPVPLGDAKRTIRHVRHHAATFGIDPARIGILGFSAGGHLASSAAVHFDEGDAEAADPVERVSSRPNAAILCYPVITFGEYRHNGSRVNLLGEDAPQELVELMSSERQVTANTPPTFIWHTSDDAAVPVENALLMAAALSKHKVPFELHSYESGRHGLGLAEDQPETHTWTRLCELWLRKQGW